PRYKTDAASPSEYATATRLSCVCDASNALPMSGSATFATDRLRLATAARSTSSASAGPALAGPVPRSLLTVTPGAATPTNVVPRSAQLGEALRRAPREAGPRVLLR